MLSPPSPSPPRPEAFGLTAEEVRRAPCLFLASHRRGLLVAGYGGAVLAVFLAVAVVTGSISTAVYLSAVLVGAGSILLVPLLICAACVGERAELAWWCRRVPRMQALAAYREALQRYREQLDDDRNRPRLDWRTVDRTGLCEAVRGRLEAAGCSVRRVVDPAAEGFDLEVRRPDGALVLVRCAAGRRPAGPALVRDLLGAWTATGARHAVLVAPAGATPDLPPNPALTVTGLDGLADLCS